jgi:hypothetical protein
MALDSMKKIEMSKEIAAFFTNARYQVGEIKSIIQSFDIGHLSHREVEGLYNHLNILSSFNDSTVERLHKYLAPHMMNYFFYNKLALEVLEDDKYKDLKLYLKECHKCASGELKLAFAILMRSLIEIALDLYNIKGTLEKKIDSFINGIDDNPDFEIFKKYNKAEELKEFLTKVRKGGNSVAHVNKDFINYINNHDSTTTFKLFCLFVEYSVLKDDIKKLQDEKASESFASINFGITNNDVPF